MKRQQGASVTEVSKGGTQPLVMIVVLNWNGAADTCACLESLEKVEYGNFQVVVVDNGSSDDSLEHLRRHDPELALIESPVNLGFSGGCNLGIRYALEHQVDFILLLNNDTRVAPGFLGELVRAADADPAIGLLNPKVLYHDAPNVLWYAGGRYPALTRVPYHIGRNERDRGQHDEAIDVEFVTGCALLVRRRLVEEIGLLDERLFMYVEDADWSLRAQRAGYRARYVPTAVVWHKQELDPQWKSGDEVRLYHTTKNLMFVANKHLDPARFALFLFGFSLRWLIYMTLKTLRTGNWKGAVAISRGFVDFWPMRRGRNPRSAHAPRAVS